MRPRSKTHPPISPRTSFIAQHTRCCRSVKDGGGKVSHLITELEIVCLPKHLPEYLEIDVSELELDAMLKMSDIKLPEGVSVPALAHPELADDIDIDIVIVILYLIYLYLFRFLGILFLSLYLAYLGVVYFL